MYTTTQIEIIKIFGKKELLEGCIVSGNEIDLDGNIMEDISHIRFFKESPAELSNQRFIFATDGKEYILYDILGHIPHLEDVFRIAKNKEYTYEVTSHDVGLCFWNEIGIQTDYMVFDTFYPELPLLGQDEDTLAQLITLLK